ncbi:hypothetical protein F2Q69_00041175 [Brassica cretica]|uniref:Uncharacterized protein n=1 Tax=Brassica cretica TaxID=69181 RepID=A0A8S9NU96_BRACR|nr:hypothetical protein F2Q69_00041175 [Brassica cretica]
MLVHLGLVPVTVISSKEAAEVLRTQDKDCCTRPKLVGSRLISRGFKDIGFTQYSEVERAAEQECNLLAKKLSESSMEQSPVDLSKTLFCLTASILFAFGESFHESKIIDQEKIGELVFEGETALASFTFSDFFPIAGVGWLFDLLSGQRKKLNDVYLKLDVLFQHMIDDHMSPERSKDHDDIIDLMLKVIHKQGKGDSLRFTVDHIKGVLANIFFTGIDTGAITMIWTMTELARNMEVMKKVQGENHRRRYRETMAHIKVQGYDIPPKRQILVNAWAIGRDPKLWTTPEEFNPDRFIDSPVGYKGQDFGLLPFVSGRRICPGMAMGMATVELVLLNLLYFFDWKLPDGMTDRDIDIEEAGTLTVVKKVPLKLVSVLHSPVTPNSSFRK